MPKRFSLQMYTHILQFSCLNGMKNFGFFTERKNMYSHHQQNDFCQFGNASDKMFDQDFSHQFECTHSIKKRKEKNDYQNLGIRTFEPHSFGGTS